MVKYEAVCGGFGFEERNVDEKRLFEFHNAREMIVANTSFEQEENKLATWSLREITSVINMIDYLLLRRRDRCPKKCE